MSITGVKSLPQCFQDASIRPGTSQRTRRAQTRAGEVEGRRRAVSWSWLMAEQWVNHGGEWDDMG